VDRGNFFFDPRLWSLDAFHLAKKKLKIHKKGHGA
jgi:hypothetical protein